MKNIALLLCWNVMLCGSSAAQEDKKSAREIFTFSAGKSLMVRLAEDIDTRREQTGDRIVFATAQLIPISASKAIPAGMKIEGRIALAKRPGRISGVAEVGVILEKNIPFGR